MKLIIAGGRDYIFDVMDDLKLDVIHQQYGVTLVISGGASGADRGGESWAMARGIPTQIMPADWNKHGRAAGPIRNKQMAEMADAVALFPGGRGTASMANEAAKAGIRIFDFRGGK